MLSKFKNFFFYSLLIITTIFLFELVSVIIFYIRQDKFYYSYDFKKEEIGENFQIPSVTFHPYFGYVLKPGGKGKYPGKGWEADWATNNSGFHFIDDPEILVNYPYFPTKDEIIVGIFGSSVGSGLALHAQMNNLLSDSIKKKYPEYRKKKIRFLNFSLPGYKQPQPLHALIYSLGINQKLDIVINIDGFSQIIVGYENWKANADVINPSYSTYTMRGQALDKTNISNNYEYYSIRYHKLRAKKLEYFTKTKSAFIYYLNKIRGRFHGIYAIYLENLNKELFNQINEFSQFPKSFINTKTDSEEQFYKLISENWYKSSKMMKIICDDNDIKYHHFLEPNQWYKKAGTYIPINKDHKYEYVIEPVNKGYKLFLSYRDKFKENNMNFKDLTSVFEQNDFREMYSDDCCHYTKKGYHTIFKKLFEE